MIEGLELAATLLQDQPDNAIILFQLLAWVRTNTDDPAHEAEADTVEEFVYSKTEECARHREADKKRFLLQLVETTSTGS